MQRQDGSDLESAALPGSEIPGGRMPIMRPLPDTPVWLSLAHLLAFPVGGLGAFLMAWVLLGSLEMGSAGFVVGLVLASWFSKDIKDIAMSSGAQRRLKPKADADPPDVDACVQLGLRMANTNPPRTPAFVAAEGYLRRASEIEPGNRDARIGLALAFRQEKAHKAIIELLAEWLSAHPDMIGELLLASALRHEDHHQGSVIHYRRALELSPSLNEAWVEPLSEIQEYIRQHEPS